MSNMDLNSNDFYEEISIDCEDELLTFRAYQLKPDLYKAIVECGFEYPSKVQYDCVPRALRGLNILCHASPGMGKTATFVLATLHQLEPVDNKISVLVLCHSQELAFEISKEYERFCKYLPSVKVEVFCGGKTVDHDEKVLQTNCPHIVIGTPGRILSLLDLKLLNLGHIRHFVLDEYEKLLVPPEMQIDVYAISHSIPLRKQVMLFSAELYDTEKKLWKKIVRNPGLIQGNDMDKTTVALLWHYYVKLKDDELKKSKLFELLDVLDFSKMVIYTRTVSRCIELSELLTEHTFPAIAIHQATPEQEKMSKYLQFKNSDPAILVATNSFGRGMYFEKVEIVISYDAAEDFKVYVQRVSRAGQFGTKRLVLTFLSDEAGANMLNDVQYKFDVALKELPESIFDLPQQIGLTAADR